jgi:lactoylglutathione lyase
MTCASASAAIGLVPLSLALPMSLDETVDVAFNSSDVVGLVAVWSMRSDQCSENGEFQHSTALMPSANRSVGHCPPIGYHIEHRWSLSIAEHPCVTLPFVPRGPHPDLPQPGALPAIPLAGIVDGGVASTRASCADPPSGLVARTERRVTTFKSLTPNLVVHDIARSLAFYRDALGLLLKQTVPDQEPFVFAWLERGSVQVFLNDYATVQREMPAVAKSGGSGMYIIVDGLDSLLEQVSKNTPLVMPLTKQFYGMREFAVADPDGHVVTFAEPYE